MSQITDSRESRVGSGLGGRNCLACGTKARDGGDSMIPESPLDDPDKAAFAWARYRRLMRWMLAFTLTVVVVAVVLLYRSNAALGFQPLQD